MEEAHSVAKLLKTSGIDEIVVIDDAFDPPDRAHVESPESFWTAVRETPDAKEALLKLKPVEEEADIDDELVAKLWAQIDDGSSLSELAGIHLFGARLQQRKDLQDICGHLESIGYKPKTRGAKDDSPITARLVFLDYVLDSLRKMDPDELATARAKDIYKQAAPGRKPFIVLISDYADAGKEHQNFRKKSELIGGLFGFLRKSDATIKHKLFLRLASWGIGNPGFEDLQTFVAKVLEAVSSAAANFADRIRALSIHDYSFIQRLSLQEEGHPLGDYLMWLFECSLGHELRADRQVRDAQTKLDTMQFTRHIPSDGVPSDLLAEFYLSAVTEPAIPEFQAHPLDTTSKTPLLFLGDIFLKDVASPVLMVVTAECDLAFRPLDKPQSDLAQPVYLAPGFLKEVSDHSPRGSGVCTELVVLKDQDKSRSYRIEWDYKHVESARLGEVWNTLKKSNYKRTWRLRLPYALSVQQAFVNHVSRLGLPVPPPMFQEANVQFYVRDEGTKKCKVAGANVVGGAALINGQSGPEIIFTGECIDHLMTQLEQLIEEAERAATAIAESPESEHKAARVTAAQGRVATIRSLATETAVWVKMLDTPFKKPKKDKHEPVDAKLLWAFFEAEMADRPMDKQPMFFANVSIAKPTGGGVGAAGETSETQQFESKEE